MVIKQMESRKEIMEQQKDDDFERFLNKLESFIHDNIPVGVEVQTTTKTIENQQNAKVTNLEVRWENGNWIWIDVHREGKTI